MDRANQERVLRIKSFLSFHCFTFCQVITYIFCWGQRIAFESRYLVGHFFFLEKVLSKSRTVLLCATDEFRRLFEVWLFVTWATVWAYLCETGARFHLWCARCHQRLLWGWLDVLPHSQKRSEKTYWRLWTFIPAGWKHAAHCIVLCDHTTHGLLLWPARGKPEPQPCCVISIWVSPHLSEDHGKGEPT